MRAQSNNRVCRKRGQKVGGQRLTMGEGEQRQLSGLQCTIIKSGGMD